MLGENIAAKPSQSVQNDNTDNTVAANQRPSVSLPIRKKNETIGSQSFQLCNGKEDLPGKL